MGHYSHALNPKALRRSANACAEALKADLTPGEIPVLCFRGLSGTASATALSLALDAIGVDHGMVYVRKPGEQSHGEACQRELPALPQGSVFVQVFVDDFISSGETRSIVLSVAAGWVSFGSDAVLNAMLGGECRRAAYWRGLDREAGHLAA